MKIPQNCLNKNKNCWKIVNFFLKIPQNCLNYLQILFFKCKTSNLVNNSTSKPPKTSLQFNNCICLHPATNFFYHTRVKATKTCVLFVAWLWYKQRAKKFIFWNVATTWKLFCIILNYRRIWNSKLSPKDLKLTWLWR